MLKVGDVIVLPDTGSCFPGNGIELRVTLMSKIENNAWHIKTDPYDEDWTVADSDHLQALIESGQAYLREADPKKIAIHKLKP